MSRPTSPRVVGVLLAAGSASRFGAPKQLAVLDGRPLITHALDALLGVAAVSEVLVVVGAHGDAVTRAVTAHGHGERVVVVRCPDHATGLSASLRCGVAAARERGADAAVVHLADLPRVGSEAVAAVLTEALGADGRPRDEATRAAYAGHDGHPVVLPRVRFDDLAALSGDAGARELLRGPRTHRVEVGHLADPTDIDTPDQLEALPP